jgi:hypothetical protein
MFVRHDDPTFALASSEDALQAGSGATLPIVPFYLRWSDGVPMVRHATSPYSWVVSDGRAGCRQCGAPHSDCFGTGEGKLRLRRKAGPSTRSGAARVSAGQA